MTTEERLRQLRYHDMVQELKDNGLSISDLARILGVSRSTIKKRKSGQTPVDVEALLALNSVYRSELSTLG